MKTNWLGLMLLIVCPTTQLAQSSTPAQAGLRYSGLAEAKGIRDQRRQEVISLVERTAAEAPLWTDKKASVHVLADAADLLWEEHPEISAKWLKQAWNLIDQISEPQSDDPLKEFFTPSEQRDLRTAVLVVARSHDPDLAERFLRLLSQDEPAEKKDRGAFDDRTARSAQLLQMAQQALASSPQTAFALAEQSLTDGISFGLQNVLTSLRAQNVELANRLFDLALTRLRNSAPDPSEAEVLAGYLFRPGFTFSSNSRGQIILVINPAQQNLPPIAASEPERARAFLTAVYERLLARPIAPNSPAATQRAQQTLVLGRRLDVSYRTFAPDLAPAARAFTTQLHNQLSPEVSNGNELSSVNNVDKAPTPEAAYEAHLTRLEDRADNERNPIAKKLAYVEAALATKPEDYQRAKKLIDRIENDDELRADANSFVSYRGALFFVAKSDLERAATLARETSDLRRRAVVKIAMAQALTANSERKDSASSSLDQQRALDLLNEVEADLGKAQPSAKVAKIALARTAVLAKLDRDQALAALEKALQIINRLETFDLRDRAAPNLGMESFSVSGATVAGPNAGFDFRSAIDPLIVSDFEQISGVAGRFSLPDVSGTARMEVARLYLNKTRRAIAKETTAKQR